MFPRLTMCSMSCKANQSLINIPMKNDKKKLGKPKKGIFLLSLKHAYPRKHVDGTKTLMRPALVAFSRSLETTL